ncbi:RNA pol II accessory factor Cdc73 family protein [Theileria parva strain Muguga]|uniref:RNA pol II accessory factor Cdc73 family protein n=1 Tax=Theileria parva strain Muguga TaxID=333668 RepID=UPI001C6210D9|nr:RNA pol II accessory factor Cdc73 family protein [Theileria parva strain Muguga]EAN31654.2 RNA pol II accessory factor Cdc73 family protein [Theileria parva strain Muguga]
MEGNYIKFDKSWDLKPDPSLVSEYWRDSPNTESILLLKSIIINNYVVEFLNASEGFLVAQLPDFNLQINVLSPSGLTSRRGEMYLIADILLALRLLREEYTYQFVTDRDFKYINILERDRIKSILEEIKVSPELLNFKVEYRAVNPQLDVKIPGKTLETSSKTSTTKLTVKDILHNLYSSLSKLHSSVKNVKSDENGGTNENLSNNNQLNEYLNTFVFVTCIQERPVRTRNSLLTAHGEGFEKILMKADATSDSVKKIHKSDHGSSKSMSKMKVVDEICCKYRKRPIIIVPSGTSSIISRQNIKQLLQDHQFVDQHQSMKNDGILQSNLPMNAVEIVHTVGKKPVKFRVVENSYVSRFTNHDWVSVVCVVLNVKGERWQFNNYPFESFIDMFMTLKGVLFVHDGDIVPSEMCSWDIKVFRISRSHRHNDASVSREFWQYIDNFLLHPRLRKISHTKKL